MGDVTPTFPRPTAQVQPYFEVLGLEDTLKFLEAFGGTEVRYSLKPRQTSKLVGVVGYAKARALGSVSHRLQRRTPIAKEWRARVYRSKGLNIADIARKLSVSDVTVRKYLDERPPGDEAQLSFF